MQLVMLHSGDAAWAVRLPTSWQGMLADISFAALCLLAAAMLPVLAATLLECILLTDALSVSLHTAGHKG